MRRGSSTRDLRSPVLERRSDTWPRCARSSSRVTRAIGSRTSRSRAFTSCSRPIRAFRRTSKTPSTCASATRRCVRTSPSTRAGRRGRLRRGQPERASRRQRRGARAAARWASRRRPKRREHPARSSSEQAGPSERSVLRRGAVVGALAPPRARALHRPDRRWSRHRDSPRALARRSGEHSLSMTRGADQ